MLDLKSRLSNVRLDLVKIERQMKNLSSELEKTGVLQVDDPEVEKGPESLEASVARISRAIEWLVAILIRVIDALPG